MRAFLFSVLALPYLAAAFTVPQTSTRTSLLQHEPLQQNPIPSTQMYVADSPDDQPGKRARIRRVVGNVWSGASGWLRNVRSSAVVQNVKSKLSGTRTGAFLKLGRVPNQTEETREPVAAEEKDEDRVQVLASKKVEQILESSALETKNEETLVGDEVFEEKTSKRAMAAGILGGIADRLYTTDHTPVTPDEIREARQQPKPAKVEEALAKKYAAIESVEERAYAILIDLGMVQSFSGASALGP